MTYVTDLVKSFIGKEGPERISEPIDMSEVRRFSQAIMDADLIFWDRHYAKKTRYKAVVAPPLFATHWFRTLASEGDYLTEGFRQDKDFDGYLLEKGGVEAPNLSLKRILNGGNDIEFFRYPQVGDRIVAKSKIVDIYEKEGKSGFMVFVVTETTYKNQMGDLLLISRQTMIRR